MDVVYKSKLATCIDLALRNHFVCSKVYGKQFYYTEIDCTNEDIVFQAKCRKYVGHSAHVTNTRFTRDDSKLVSTGGDDSWYVLN